MDKNAIKKYAVWARNELIARVTQKALKYGITAEDPGDPNAKSIGDTLLSDTEVKQRTALIAQIRNKGFEQVMEEVSYTWFNRFAALRFMEVNSYLPSHVRVFTDDNNAFKPQILSEAIHLELDGLDMDKVYELKNDNRTEELFQYLLIVQCNALNAILPGMFQKIADYTELLLPDYLLREGSVVEQMVAQIAEDDWKDQVQIIGWLYQYYNSEPKDKVFADLKKNIKITKEKIPAATQLFTPDWIVHYMVENSLGRLWLEGHPNDELKSEWKYYLDEAEQEPEVEAKLVEIRKEYAALKPEEIRVIDPCQGSGHILCVLFDTLVKIYEDYGYTAREAAASIVENNIWGLDIDERASQLAYFSVMMKARQYDRRFFSRGVQPHVYAIQESNNLDQHAIEYFVDGRKELKSAMDTLIKELHDAKEYGSILNVSKVDFDELYSRFKDIENIQGQRDAFADISLDILLPFVKVGEAISQKYNIVVTNPPYMTVGNGDNQLNTYIKKNYPDSKSDMFAVFMERCHFMTIRNGMYSMITQHAWMFLSSFEKLREKIQQENIVCMAHLGSRAFDEIGGEVVQTTCFVVSNKYLKGRKGVYSRLVDPTSELEKEALFLSGKQRFNTDQEIFLDIPGCPIAYWASPEVINAYKNYPGLGEVASPKQGLATTDNNRFVRFWSEVELENIGFGYSREEAKDSGIKWFPLNKGGEYRKWYGNNDCIVNYQNDGAEIKANVLKKYTYLKTPDFVVKNQGFYFKENGTWSAISTGDISVRYSPKGFVISNAGMAIFSEDRLKYIIAFMNSRCISGALLGVISQTLNYNAGDLEKIPFIYNEQYAEEVVELADKCINLSKDDWDSYESSWDFQRHPLMPDQIASCGGESRKIEDIFSEWKKLCELRRSELKKSEERINEIFIEVYGLQNEITSEVSDDELSIKSADLQRDIISLISYAVGCMFGRYSVDRPGLIYAGGAWDPTVYSHFVPDADNIIPICDDDYFDDDIVGRFVDFIECVYGKDVLEDNLQYIANAIGGKGQAREALREYFLNGFYNNHVKMYQKRPIYWLFDSGKKNGFKCLIYMHRYQRDSVARIRTDYVHEIQSRYRTALAELEKKVSNSETSGKVKLNKEIKKIQDQANEVHSYEEEIHHLADQMISIDLDDGVKSNYDIFSKVLAKLK